MPSHGAQPGRPHDERDAFFRDLRALRARRGLDLGEIAERTRFPLDMLAAAETGPGLPSLPTLSAYLRGCGEPLASWEDRQPAGPACALRRARPSARQASWRPGKLCPWKWPDAAATDCPRAEDNAPTEPG